jgi:hypothetical protein
MATHKHHMQDKKDCFLGTLAKTCNVSHAASVAGLKRATAWDEALETSLDALEQEARRRALEGVEEAVYYQGKKVRQSESTVTHF